MKPRGSLIPRHHAPHNQSTVNKNNKRTFSPARSNQQVKPHTFEEHELPLVANDGQLVLAESWPPADSVTRVLSGKERTPTKSTSVAKSTVSSGLADQRDSVLAKYIERFRHGHPQSREERQQQLASAVGEERGSFWWKSPSPFPPCSTPTKTTHTDDHRPAIFSLTGQHRQERSPSPCRMSHSILSDASQSDIDDLEILHLQERASRLQQRLDRAHSDGSSPAGPEVLGCSDYTPPVSVDEPGQIRLIPSLIRSATATARSDSGQAVSSQKSPVVPSTVHPACPEEDILSQWRFRRKSEQTSKWSQSHQLSSFHSSTLNWQAPSLHHSSTNGQAYEPQQSCQLPELSQRASHLHVATPQPETKGACKPLPPTSSPLARPAPDSSVSEPQPILHVPVHMHLLYNVLPCPTQSSHVCTQQSLRHKPEDSPTQVDPNKAQAPANSKYPSTDECVRKRIQPAPPALSKPVEGDWPHQKIINHHKRTERNKKVQTTDMEKNEKKLTSINQQKKTARRYTDGSEYAGHRSTNRSSAHQRVPKKDMSWTAQQQQQKRCPELSSESCAGDYAPPSSPIHNVLGQVVSEVLFPTVDAAPAQKSAAASASPRTVSATPEPPLPVGNADNSMEVISQLLQAAEDSDETEFKDDPLLQVLRKQRSWVKKQISEVDSMLETVPDEQQVT